jgi:CheY-like chemotaxis protein
MFTQVTDAYGRSEGGVGIGLALAKVLTEMHGGTIEVRSAGLGHGSEFIVKIPLAKARALPAKQPSVDQERGQPLRILVADDNSDACETLGVLLELMGHQVRLTRNGQEALSECRANPPDVAILDIGMPKMSGYEVARTLRAEIPDLFLIAASGWAQADDLTRSQASGFDRHLVKPLDPDALGLVLAEFAKRGDSA